MLHAVKEINGASLWANMHLLFWLSLIPFVTAWMGHNHFSRWTVASYGFVALKAAIPYTILSRKLTHETDKNAKLAMAIGKDAKGKLSLLFYFLGIVISFVEPLIGLGLYATVSVIWFLPDRRIEKILSKEKEN